MPLGSTQLVSCQQLLRFQCTSLIYLLRVMNTNKQSIVYTTSTTSTVLIVITRNVKNYKVYVRYTIE